MDLSSEESVQHRKDILARLLKEESALLGELFPEVDLNCLSSVEDKSAIDQLKADYRKTLTLRLQFLSLSTEERSSLLSLSEAGADSGESSQAIKKNIETAKSDSATADKSLREAELDTRSAATLELQQLAANRAELEQLKKDLASIQLEASTQWEQKSEEYKLIAKILSEMTGAHLMKQRISEAEIYKDYLEASSQWRQLVDRTFEVILDARPAERISPLPTYPTDLLNSLGEIERAAAFKESYQKAQIQRDNLIQLVQERSQSHLSLHYKMLLDAGKLRSILLAKLIVLGNTQPLEWTDRYFADLSREVRITPYRWIGLFYTKFLQFNQHIKGGVAGIISFIQESFQFFVFLLMLFGFGWLLKNLQIYLERLRSKMVDASYSKKWAREGAMWLQRINPHASWLLVLLACSFSRRLLQNTVFAEVAGLIPYVEFYAYYRILRILMVVFFSKVLTFCHVRINPERSERIQQTSRSLGLFLLWIWWFLHAVESAASKGFIYLLVDQVLIFFLWLFVIYTFRHWREDVAKALEGRVSNRIGDFLIKLCRGQFHWVGTVPSFVLICLLYTWNILSGFGERFDIVKRLSAQIFRRRVEGISSRAEQISHELPSEYTAWFKETPPDSSEMVLPVKDNVIAKIMTSVERWDEDDSDEHTIGLVGEKGSGKSTFLLRLQEKLSTKYRVVSISIPPKLTQPDEVLKFFGEKIGNLFSQNDDISDIGTENAGNAKTIVLIDEAQNLFLGKIGGFEGLRQFFELFNRDVENFYWIVNFNNYSWYYVNSVFKKAPFFSSNIYLEGWTEKEIQDLIMSRHNKTGFKLSFDDILYAARIDDDIEGTSYVESRFFRLLWEEARGNPRTALRLWQSCLDAGQGNTLKVGLPTLRSEGRFGASMKNHFLFSPALFVMKILILPSL